MRACINSYSRITTQHIFAYDQAEASEESPEHMSVAPQRLPLHVTSLILAHSKFIFHHPFLPFQIYL